MFSRTSPFSARAVKPKKVAGCPSRPCTVAAWSSQQVMVALELLSSTTMIVQTLTCLPLATSVRWAWTSWIMTAQSTVCVDGISRISASLIGGSMYFANAFSSLLLCMRGFMVVGGSKTITALLGQPFHCGLLFGSSVMLWRFQQVCTENFWDARIGLPSSLKLKGTVAWTYCDGSAPTR